ncbi:MAG: TonB-dependent receptor [Saprospiraceae bacterium]|nr:TonB-dependent receptor [Saprospiraceae bacterium]
MKMKFKIFFLVYIVFLSQTALGQSSNVDDTINIPEFVVTANRSIRNIDDVPGRVAVIDAKTIEELPVQNVDEILRSISSIYVNRSWGIFSQNSSVTMRGLDASARVLVLVDGVPLNKSAGGSVNWHLISVNNIERIEVIKGPASTIYGNNAMAGVINIITKNPKKPLQGEVGLLASSYNSYGGNFNLSGTNIKKNNGFTWSLNSFYRQGDGYILEKEELRDSTDVNAFLMEYSIAGKLAYSFNKNHKLEFAVQTYDDLRGQGRKVYEEYGDYMSVNTSNLRLSYEGIFNKTVLNVNSFYQIEDEFKQSESVSANSGKYKLSDRDSRKDDYGVWVNATTYISDKNILSYGIDLKQGKADVTNTYMTSTDVLIYSGILDFYGIFVQDEINLLNDKLTIVAGARFDNARYYKGKLIVENPTSNTGFVTPFDEDFINSKWNSFSPKIALKYKFNKSQSVYISYSKGFMPPKLDDLSKSGKINKGFKLANPELGPEYISNYEIGFNLIFFKKLTIEPSIYYSLGKDFQYFVGTGDSVDTGGDAIKPVYQRQNISNVEVIGAEISTKYQLLKNLQISANYTFNESKIKDYNTDKANGNDISGNFLIEVPKHMVYAGLSWKNKYFNTTISYNYISSQWYDDENTISIDEYDIIDLQLSREFAKKFYASLNIQNILNDPYIDRKGYLSPGRFITGEIKFKF